MSGGGSQRGRGSGSGVGGSERLKKRLPHASGGARTELEDDAGKHDAARRAESARAATGASRGGQGDALAPVLRLLIIVGADGRASHAPSNSLDDQADNVCRQVDGLEPLARQPALVARDVLDDDPASPVQRGGEEGRANDQAADPAV